MIKAKVIGYIINSGTVNSSSFSFITIINSNIHNNQKEILIFLFDEILADQ